MWGKHLIATAALVGALAAPGLGGTAQAEPGAAATNVAQRAKPPVTTRTVHRAYGGSGVRQKNWRQRIRLVFSGRAGDEVALSSDLEPYDDCESAVLAGPRGALKVKKSGFFRLNATGRFVFTYRQNCWISNGNDAPWTRGTARVQLLKARYVKATVGGRSVTLPRQRGYISVAHLLVPRDAAGTLTLDQQVRWQGWSDVYSQRDRRRSTKRASRIFDPDGQAATTQGAMAVEIGSTFDGTRVRAGASLFMYDYSRVVKLTVREQADLAVTVDGEAVEIARGTPRRLSFTASAGQWIRLDVAGTRADAVLRRADGTKVGVYAPGTEAPAWLWHVPSAGTYTMTLTPRGQDTTTPVAVRVRSVTPGAELVAGAAAATRSVAGDDWTLLPITGAGTDRWYLHVSRATLPEGWTAVLMSPRPTAGEQRQCLREVARTESRLGDPTYVLLMPKPGTTGELDLALTTSDEAPSAECWPA